MQFHKSREAFEAENLLAAGKPGDVITTSEASRRLQTDCSDSKARGWKVLSSRIKFIERSHNLVWRWDREQKHWKCLTDAEKAADMSQRVTRINTYAKRNERVLNTMDLEKMPEEDRKTAIVMGTISGAVKMSTSAKAKNTLGMFAGDTPQIPDEAVLMRLFVKAK